MKKIVSLLLVFILLLGGCSSKDSGKLSTPDGSESEVVYKDTIVYAQQKDITSLDPHVGREATAIQTTINIFSTLLTVDENLNPIADVAKEWEQVSDKVWKFYIRDNIKFHDGSKLTAEDVKFSIDRAIESPKTNYLVNFIDKVDVVDEYTVTITTIQPYAAILRNLAHPAIAIVPKTLVEADPEILKTKPIGSGPYKFVEWEQGQYCKLEAFEDYFLGESPTKNLIMKVVPEGAQRIIGLETAEIDIAYDLLPNDKSKVSSNPDLKLNASRSLWIYYLCFNTTKSPLDNQKVRQAIRYGIDAKAIVDTELYGAGEVATSLIPVDAFGYSDKGTKYSHDVEKAKTLLKEAGYPDGFDIEILARENQIRVEMAQIIQSQLKEIGINVNINVVSSAIEMDLTNSGQFDIAIMQWSTPPADADYTYYPIFHSDQHGASGNRSYLSDSRVDELIMKGKFTSDQDERQKIYDELDILLSEISNVAPICSDETIIGMNAKTEGFVAHGAGYHKLYGVTIKK